jgi:hypothetical protein
MELFTVPFDRAWIDEWSRVSPFDVIQHPFDCVIQSLTIMRMIPYLHRELSHHATAVAGSITPRGIVLYLESIRPTHVYEATDIILFSLHHIDTIARYFQDNLHTFHATLLLLNRMNGVGHCVIVFTDGNYIYIYDPQVRSYLDIHDVIQDYIGFQLINENKALRGEGMDFSSSLFSDNARNLFLGKTKKRERSPKRTVKRNRVTQKH